LTSPKKENQLMKPILICILAALVSGCGLSIRSQSKPACNDLSGTYRYVGLGTFTPAQFPNPLVEFENIAVPCDIQIIHEGRGFQTHYKDKSGSPVSKTLDLNQKQKGISWDNRELVTTKRVPVEGSIILPLPGKHFRGTRLFRNEDGNLVVVGFFKEKGLFWTDYSEDEMTLERKND
jgi:hypothetical protein